MATEARPAFLAITRPAELRHQAAGRRSSASLIEATGEDASQRAVAVAAASPITLI